MPLRTARSMLFTMVAGSASVLAAFASPAYAIEFGTPTVLSQNGQRLKVAIPIHLSKDEHASVTRFSVSAAEATGGTSRLAPDDLSIALPERAGVLYLQSSELVDAQTVHVELAVHDGQSAPARFTLAIPRNVAATTGGGTAARHGQLRATSAPIQTAASGDAH